MFVPAFHGWSISWRSSVQAVPRGNSTIDPHNFRKRMSRRPKSQLYMARWPPAKHVSDITANSKYRKRFTMETFSVLQYPPVQMEDFRCLLMMIWQSHILEFRPTWCQHATMPPVPPITGQNFENHFAVVWWGSASWVMTHDHGKQTRSNCLTGEPTRQRIYQFPHATAQSQDVAAKRKSSQLTPPSNVVLVAHANNRSRGMLAIGKP